MTMELSGTTLAGRYDLLALLGRGGMGAVYRAHDRELDETVALKVISGAIAERPDSAVRFRSEVKLARRVTHRNLARTFELGHDGAITFCTMELVEGQSLRHRLATGGKLPVAEALAIACSLCDGLAAAHAAGVIHRDIKPDNVLLATDGRVVLADFGVAVARVEGTAEIVGTAAYMAPEQAAGEPPSPAADVYAVGVVLYEMLTGTRAFTGTDARIVEVKRAQPRLTLTGVAPELAFAVARATAADPRERFTAASALGQALAPWAAPTALAAASDTTGVELEMHRVVVLPVRGDQRQLHIARAIYDELLVRLARQPRLRVLTRLGPDDPRPAATITLDARDELRVSIARPGTAAVELWVPLTIEDLEATSATAAAAIADAVTHAPPTMSAREVDAREMMLRAREMVGRNVAEYQQASVLLERASELDPHDPSIMAALAVSNVRRAFFGADASLAHLERARGLVGAALAAGPDLVDAHLAAGHLELHTGDAALAARHFRTAIACAPHVAEGHDQLGRLLLEAGFLALGQARLDDARAIAPVQSSRWELARAWALEGDRDAAQREIARLVAVSGPRPVPMMRMAWWRRDPASLARMYGEYAPLLAFDSILTAGACESVIHDAWDAWRDRMIARAVEPCPSRRRSAFAAQVVAEIAGYHGDRVTCLEMLRHASTAGMFDLHWLDRCELLDPARDAAGFALVRVRVKRRADAILDALYGDPVEPEDAPETIAG